MKELVVISGKGGTGKTSMVAAFASLSGRVAIADCDVDAANLHLVTAPETMERYDFSGGHSALIDTRACTSCGTCSRLCRFDAVFTVPEQGSCESAEGEAEESGGGVVYGVDPLSCEGCGVCAWFCPAGAIRMVPEHNGEWFVSRTANGPMVHARLRPGSENSGKLVTEVRRGARAVAEREGIDTLIVDGSPGTGCPVIASLTGADAVLIVTEPGKSAMSDLDRVLSLVRHFGLEAAIAVNRSDINDRLTKQIIDMAAERSIPFAGCVRFDEDFTRAQICGKSITDFSTGTAAADVADIWAELKERYGLDAG